MEKQKQISTFSFTQLKPKTYVQVQLDVLHKPEIEPEQVFIHTKDGEEVEVSSSFFPKNISFPSYLLFCVQVVCIIHASPAPSKVEWLKNGAVMDPSMNVMTRRGNRHSLLIQKIGEFLSGQKKWFPVIEDNARTTNRCIIEFV